ncbi:MAG: hypothetical protein JXQ89_22600 [Pelagimonas sp.]
MRVTQVRYAGFRDDTPDGPTSGAVTLVGEDSSIQLQITLPRRIEILNSQHRLLLLAEALKQARRMPEYRSRGALRLSECFLPHKPRKKA